MGENLSKKLLFSGPHSFILYFFITEGMRFHNEVWLVIFGESKEMGDGRVHNQDNLMALSISTLFP